MVYHRVLSLAAFKRSVIVVALLFGGSTELVLLFLRVGLSGIFPVKRYNVFF